MRVALVSHSLGWGGLERVLLDLARGLDRARFEPVCVSLTDDQAMGGVFDEAGIERHVVVGRPVEVALRLRRWLRCQRIGLLHAHNFGRYFHGGPAALLAGIPSLYTEHSNLRPEERLLWRAQPAFSRLASVVIADAAGVREVLIAEHGLAPERVEVIYNGIDLAAYGVMPRAEARAALGLPAEARLLGTVARLVPIKHQALMLQALARIRHSTHLVIAGDGPLRGELESLAASLGLAGRVRFLGRRDDVPTVLAALDGFVLTSLSEGLPISVIEAMAAGLPVVATAVGGLAELVESDRTGLLVPSGDVEALAAALNRLDAETGAAWGQAGRAVAEARYSRQAMVEAYQAVYERCLTRAGTEGGGRGGRGTAVEG